MRILQAKHGNFAVSATPGAELCRVRDARYLFLDGFETASANWFPRKDWL
jgi:hypothetical protein